MCYLKQYIFSVIFIILELMPIGFIDNDEVTVSYSPEFYSSDNLQT